MKKRSVSPQNAPSAEIGTSKVARVSKPAAPLKRGWTTGACATAATKAALVALLEGDFPDPVSITLPKGETPSFPIAMEELSQNTATVGIVKDAGDDPDVTHGAMIKVSLDRSVAGTGITFNAGEGVGTVTKPGLPIAMGEAAINPVPRQMMSDVIHEICERNGVSADIEVTVSVPGGEALAQKTWNPRLGIMGGLSILGTTGIVHPFSCSAWIHSIHRGIDVSRANGITHVLGATGSTSERVACDLYGFSEIAMLDMGDFAGGLLKYLRANPVARITLAGGFAKLTKLAQGHLDLHSARSQVDMDWLAERALNAGLNQNFKLQIQSANTAMEVLELTMENGIDIASPIATLAQEKALQTLRGAPVEVEVMIISRSGELIARTGWQGPKDGKNT